MTEIFPKRRSTSKVAEIGINIASTVFNDDFGWIFRRTHQEHDFGIDGYVDYVTPHGSVTGQFIAVQIKTGQSYLSSNGNFHWYRDTKAHLNYFLNLPTPLILIVCNPETRICYWEKLDKDKIDYSENGWRHPIPRTKILCSDSLREIREFFGETQDYVNEFERDYEMLGSLSENSFIQYCIPRKDIETLNMDNLKKFISRITRNERLTLAIQGRLYIATNGYELDSREVYQIGEIKRWANAARKEISEWYLCAGEPSFSTLKWIASCTCSTKKKPVWKNGKYFVEHDAKKLLLFIDECFYGLNEASDKWGWSTNYNYQVSKKIHMELLPHIPFPELNS